MTTHKRALTRILDPVHDTISITCFEREIVDSEYFQRLHSVLQNSTTYVAFPSNKNSRFTHSLGVCHLTGELLVNSLKNATPEDLTDFLDTAATLIVKKEVDGNGGNPDDVLKQAWRKTISGMSGFRHAPTLRSENDQSLASINLDLKFPLTNSNDVKAEIFTAGFLADTLWQSIRVCGLVHDIGHLPMSHSLEHATDKFKSKLFSIFTKSSNSSELGEHNSEENLDRLFADVTCADTYNQAFVEFNGILEKAYRNEASIELVKNAFKQSPLHERRSIYTLLLLLRNTESGFDSDTQRYRTLIYNLAFLILISSITVSDPKSTLLSELATRAKMCLLSPASNTPCHRSSHLSVARLSGKTTSTVGRIVD